MEFHDSDDSESDEEALALQRLDTLPPEILLHIFSFLSAKYVIRVVSQVCEKFKALIENDTTWRMRIFRRWPKSYPIIPPIEGLDWKAACIAREEQHHLWSDHLENMRKYHLYGAHFGSVNVVQLIENGKICVSGGRDGYVKLWNLDPAYLADQPFNSSDNVDISSCLINASHHANLMKCFTKPVEGSVYDSVVKDVYELLAHTEGFYNAWLWDVTYDCGHKHIYTGGFDCNIKSWDAENPAEPLVTYSLSSPILCLDFNENLLASGSYGRTVTIFDPRAEAQPILKHTQHKKPVLCMVSDDKYVISGSEDKSIVVFDKIAGKVLKRFELHSFPLSMSYGEGQLIIGDVNHFLHIVDPRHGEFNLLHNYATGHTKKVTGVQHSLGSIITCSTDKTIRILEPNLKPEAIAVLESTNEVARISAYDNIIVCANVDDSISVWIPNDMFD